MKRCRLCGEEKPVSEFYKGLAQCKPCYRAKVTANRKANIEHYRAYDRDRGSRQSDNYLKEYRERFPNKYRAHNLVNNSLRDGKLFKEPCEVCGADRGVAHHDDYAKPLNVRWLCQAHHKQWHAANGEGLNA